MNTSTLDRCWPCEVRARGRVIRYRSEGMGRPLILLRAEPSTRGDAGAEWEALLAGLRKGYRLIVPEPPPPETELTGWLDAFLEGLGGSDVRMLASGRFCPAAAELALAGSDLISRLVLIPEDEDPYGELGEVHGAPDGAHARVPLLVAYGGVPAHGLAGSLVGFLGAVA